MNITLTQSHNITNQLHHGLLPKKELRLKNYDNLQYLVKKFIVHSLSASHKHEIPELKENYAHKVLGPT